MSTTPTTSTTPTQVYDSAFDNDYEYIARPCASAGIGESRIINTRTDIPIDWEKTGPKLEKMSVKGHITTIKPGIVYNDAKVKPEKYIKKKNEKKVSTLYQLADLTDFWRAVGLVRCLDKDEGAMTKANVRPLYSRRAIILNLLDTTFIPKLKEVLESTPLSDGIDKHEYNNLLTHIVFKGKMFYEAILIDPVISLYLCSQYYPIYDWITKM